MELTVSQLKEFDGPDLSKLINLSIKSTIYDVSTTTNFHGLGGHYALFAGRESSRVLTKMTKDEADVNRRIDDLTDKEKGILGDWMRKFEAKYPVIGRLV